MKHIITLTLLATLPGLAMAHGNDSHSIMTNLQHILSSPEHLWPLAVFAIVVATVKRMPRRLLDKLKIKS